MAKGSGSKVGTACHRASLFPGGKSPSKHFKNVRSKRKYYEPSEKKEWDDAACPVCMEYPHNAVLLLCSSHHKGCRPYMCATSHRYSNCLEQYQKAYTKVTEIQCSQQLNGSTGPVGLSSGLMDSNDMKEVAELSCPLCRGQVKGWTVVKKARKYFNSKKRTCMQDGCSYVGNFKGLRKHVRAEHPLARPRAVDPVLEEKWKILEREREHNDVISTIVSSTPGAMVLGDYVIEPPQHNYYRYSLVDDFFTDNSYTDEPLDLAQDGYDFGIGRPVPAGFAVAPSRSLRRFLLGRSRRRRRHRDSSREAS